MGKAAEKHLAARL